MAEIKTTDNVNKSEVLDYLAGSNALERCADKSLLLDVVNSSQAALAGSRYVAETVSEAVAATINCASESFLMGEHSYNAGAKDGWSLNVPHAVGLQLLALQQHLPQPASESNGDGSIGSELLASGDIFASTLGVPNAVGVHNATASNVDGLPVENKLGTSSATIELEIVENAISTLSSANQSHKLIDRAYSPSSGIEFALAEGSDVGSSDLPKLFNSSTAQEAQDIVRKYAEETLTTFVSMRKMKQFGVTDGGIDMERKKYRIFFESADVEYDGIPYIYVADKMYICHLGKDKTEVTRQKIRRQSMEKRLQMGLPVRDISAQRVRTKKIDCPVKITIKMIAKFPQFKVSRKTKRVCETASKKLRQALVDSAGKLSCYYAYVGRLPSLNEHNHPVGAESSFNEPIDPLLKDKIIQLTWQGVQNSAEIKKLVEQYVEHDLFAGKSPPPKSRRRYYPSIKDIRNYMSKAKMLTRLSTDIRDELHDLGGTLQHSRPTENIILHWDLVETATESLVDVKVDAGDGVAKHTLVFCHQTPQQQRLLKRYGSQVVLTEVTSGIERVPFPFYTLHVQTNVDYQLVGSFIVELRNIDSIVQGLNALKDWNPGWSPKYATIDRSDSQIEAVKVAFPNATYFFSDSSREAQWKEWLLLPENNLVESSAVILAKFQAIALAYNEEILHQAALDLENSSVWRDAPSLRSWFNTAWLLDAKRWVAGYRPEDLIIAQHIECKLETDLKLLRETHVSFMRGKKLAAVIEKLVTKILPDMYTRYLELNRKSFSQVNDIKSVYAEKLPTCLVSKTASVALHVLEQMKLTEATVYQVSHVQPGVFWVQDVTGISEDSQAHTVSFGDASSLPGCDCLDWLRFKLPCRHMCAVFSSFPDWGWDMLNVNYTANPLFNIDFSCIKPWVDAYRREEMQQGVDQGKASVSSQSTCSRSTDAVPTDRGSIDSTRTEISSLFTKMPSHSKQMVVSSPAKYQQVVGQCQDLLGNLTKLSQTISFNNEHLEALRGHLEQAVGVLRLPSALPGSSIISTSPSSSQVRIVTTSCSKANLSLSSLTRASLKRPAGTTSALSGKSADAARLRSIVPEKLSRVDNSESDTSLGESFFTDDDGDDDVGESDAIADVEDRSEFCKVNESVSVSERCLAERTAVSNVSTFAMENG